MVHSSPGSLRLTVQDEFVPAHLFLVSYDRVALHWISLNHIAWYERVDIDKFLVPQ